MAASALGQSQTPATSGVVSKIVITGNEHVSTEAILAHMKTKVGSPYLQSQLDSDRDALLQLGFFRSVDWKGVPLEGSNWEVDVMVSEFPVVKELRVVGNTVIPTDQILKVVPIQIGQPFNLSEQKPTADAIAKLYADKGYFGLATVISPIPESPNTVDIEIREMMVHSVGVQGNTRTKNSVFRRLIRTKPGEAYNFHKWDDDLRRIYGTQWFDKVDPIERETEDGTGMDLLVDVKEARTGQVTAGVTLDPRNSLAGQASLRDSNFNGTGQLLGLTFTQAISGGVFNNVSGAQGPSIVMDYANPFMNSHYTSLAVSLYSRLLYRFTGTEFGGNNSPTNQTYTERHTGMSVNVAQPIGPQLAASIGGVGENVKTANLHVNNQNNFIQQDGDIFKFPLQLNRDRRDVTIDPSRGDWFNLDFQPGFSHITRIGGVIQDQSILGSHAFTLSSLEYHYYFTKQPPRGRQLDAPRRVWAFRLYYGIESGKVPFFEQFFAGGSNTLRGYDDDRFWGTETLLTTLEYRHPIQKAFNLIAWVDYGGAWGGYGSVNTFTQYHKFRLHLGYGPGVSFRTPFGAIRLDYGFNENRGGRLHFLIGNTF